MDYVYAVVKPPLAPPAGSGLDGSPLRVVANGELAAVISDRSDAELLVSEDALWTHERVVEGLMSDRAVLPMRYGSVLRDDEAVEAMLRARRGELTAALERVSGAVELGVRAAWDAEAAASDPEVAASDPETAVTGAPSDREAPAMAEVSAPEAIAVGGATSYPDADGPGAAYLIGLSRRRQRARALAERLDRAVGELSRAGVQRLLTSPSLPVSAAYLVDRGRVDAFRDRIAILEAEVEDAELVCTGPWPPYSFSAAPGG